MIFQNDKISNRQLQALLFLDVLGTGFIILPTFVAGIAFHHSLIAVILGVALTYLSVYILMKLQPYYKGDSFIALLHRLLPKPLAHIIIIIFMLRIFVFGLFEIRFFGQIVQSFLLPKTPFSIVSVALLALAIYTAQKGYELRARLSEILIVIVLIPLSLIILLSTKEIDLQVFLPYPITQISPLIRGGLSVFSFFHSFQFLLIVMPYINYPDKSPKAMYSLLGLLGCLILLICLICLSVFGVLGIETHQYPVLDLMNATPLPGAFMEDQGAMMMSFFIVSVFGVMVASLFLSGLLMAEWLQISIQNAILILGVLLCVLSVLPEIFMHFLPIESIGIYLNIFFSYILPLGLLILARKKEGSHEYN